MNPLKHTVVGLRRLLSLVLVATVNAETAGKSLMVDWTFCLIQGEFLEEMVEMSCLPSITPAWASQVYWCVLLVYCTGSIATSAYAQSSKGQISSLYVWVHMETAYFQTFLVLFVSFLSRTCCSGLWPKAVEFFPSAGFHLSVCYVCISQEANWFAVHSRCNSACGVCISTACPALELEIHSIYEPTIPNVFGLGKGCLSGKSCLQLTLQKASNNPK